MLLEVTLLQNSYSSSNCNFFHAVTTAFALKERPNWFHMIYVLLGGMQMEECMVRATGSMLALKNWFVSVRLTGDHPEAAVEGAIRAQVVASKNAMVEVQGHLTFLLRGIPIRRKSGSITTADALDEEGDSTLVQVKQRKPAAPVPLRGVSTKVVGDSRGKEAVSSSSTSQADNVKTGERLSAERARDRAKRQRSEDIAMAAVKAAKPSRKKAPTGKPPGSEPPADQSRKYRGLPEPEE